MAQSNGGGATHIALKTGLLSELSNDISDVLIVAGGGGGALDTGTSASGGGIAGGDPSYGGSTISGKSGTQSTGYLFGKGEPGVSSAGGGGGLYGGYAGTNSSPAGAGSGYIGNSLLSGKKMAGYNVPPSSSASTMTYPKEDHSVNPISMRPKAGNGYVKIKYLGV